MKSLSLAVPKRGGGTMQNQLRKSRDDQEAGGMKKSGNDKWGGKQG